MACSAFRPVLTLAACIATALGIGVCARHELRSGTDLTLPTADATALERHLTTLAHDSMQGRAPGSRGYDLSAEYVAQQFRSAGLVAPPDGRMMRAVPLMRARLSAQSVKVSIEGNGATRELVHGTQFIVGGSFRELEVVDAPIVYAGQGVVAPWRNHDDYAALDVRGKVVAFAAGSPANLTLEERAFVEQMKVRNALAKGAIGTIQLTDTTASPTAWAKAAAAYAAIPTMGTKKDDEIAVSLFGGGTSLTLGPEASRAVLGNRVASTPGELPTRLRLEARSTVDAIRSANVAAVVRGSDPALSKEYMVVGAHLDHLGIGAPVNGDSIYNGAIDNAAGVAMLLEVARIVAQTRPAPARSVLFIAFTAEESGGLGSEHFVRGTTVPRGAIAAAMNLDGVGMWPFTALVVRGGELSNLGAAIERGVAALPLSVVRDPVPNRAAMTGSDQFAFASRGIPAVSMASARSDSGRAQALDWLARRYHQPSDGLEQAIDYQSTARLTDAVARAVLAVANMPQRPAWHSGVFYRTLE